MRFAAIVAALALAGACTTQPETADQPRPELVQPAPFQSLTLMQLRPVDAGSSYMKRLVEHVPVRAVEYDKWAIEGGPARADTYLVARTRLELESYLAAAALPAPADREIVFGRTDTGWRTYLVSSTAAVVGASITHAEFTRGDATGATTLRVDLDAAGARQFEDLTAHSVGDKVAVLIDGSVVSAPVVNSAIHGGRIEISF